MIKKYQAGMKVVQTCKEPDYQEKPSTSGLKDIIP
jgi:hypothetical protein